VVVTPQCSRCEQQRLPVYPRVWNVMYNWEQSPYFILIDHGLSRSISTPCWINLAGYLTQRNNIQPNFIINIQIGIYMSAPYVHGSMYLHITSQTGVGVWRQLRIQYDQNVKVAGLQCDSYPRVYRLQTMVYHGKHWPLPG